MKINVSFEALPLLQSGLKPQIHRGTPLTCPSDGNQFFPNPYLVSFPADN